MDRQLEALYGTWCSPGLQLLGYRIDRPFCLGMALLLEALDSPFARLSEPDLEITAADIITALRVCAAARWPFTHVDLRPNVRTRLNLWRLRKLEDRLAAAATLVSWMNACSSRPEYWNGTEKVKGGTLTAPLFLALAVSLMRRTNMTEERIWSMPLGLVSWYHGTIAEQEGSEERFFYDSELKAAARIPDLSLASEEELYALVVRDRGEEFAKKFFERRKENGYGGRN